MSLFLTSQPVCAPLKDYYNPNTQQHQWPKATTGAAVFAAPEGWMTTDENGNAKRFGTHKIVPFLKEVDNLCKRRNTEFHDGIYTAFRELDMLIFYAAYEHCYVLDHAEYFGGTDAAGTGECYRHWQMKITGEKIETRYGEEDVYSSALTWVSQWETPYVEKAKTIKSEESTNTVMFSKLDNTITRMGEAEEITFVFDKDLPESYYLELSFDSGENPTSITYQNSGQLTWMGDDCYTTQAGLSVFQPRPDTSYDVVFYCRGGHIIGKVCGYTPSVSR